MFIGIFVLLFYAITGCIGLTALGKIYMRTPKVGAAEFWLFWSLLTLTTANGWYFCSGLTQLLAGE